MKHTLSILAVCAALLIGSQVWGQNLKIEPGLWEHTVRMSSQSGQMEEMMREARRQLDALPPEQRQMMEQMMAAQGVSIGEDESTFRVCISEEDAARDQLHLADENCTQEILERSGNTLRVRFACDDDPPSHGEGEVTIVSSREYTGRAVIKTDVDGSPETINVRQTARWLSSDCGNLRPLGQ
ncbi:DUF3617 domain-containing protein [Geoalkalibacter halelectricus]|uniref:DUF3617 domain-containing protein n=1 Tax=Geoalkalibacter halelectricus TaxID=2847045 RepID=A0ABY5ZN68_9BACT|nr:DUF3617 domain-containing protein [Geoalkalibacter halelectricus]MDO3379876.1 DUF3617 domain-containing protein [Geoalkalibacter halelectricus]UWZ80595.1 DUF3617 domain-containing protein [Geoalkalibacter halelectricus]